MFTPAQEPNIPISVSAPHESLHGRSPEVDSRALRMMPEREGREGLAVKPEEVDVVELQLLK